MNYHNLEQLNLLTPRLSLKPFQPGLGNCVFEAVLESYEILEPWRIWVLNDKDKLKPEDYEQFGIRKIQLLKENKDLTLLIFDRFSAELIGAVSINKIENNNGYLGFWIRKSCMQQGYAQEAANCLIEFAFNKLGHDCVNAMHEAGNTPSQKTLLKLGFKLVNATDTSTKWLTYIKVKV